MINPAVEALKREHTELVTLLAESEGQLDPWGWHRQTKPDCDVCRVIAQAEQTPVADVAKDGRVVSEELWAMLLSRFSDPKATTTEKAILEALRAAPVYHKEES